MSHMRMFAFVAGSAVASAALGQATLYGQVSQLPPPTSGFTGIFANTEGACLLSVVPIFAEDFDLGASTTVAAVRWWGWAAAGCSLGSNRSAIEGVTSFTVTLYQNAVVLGEDVPGTAIGTPFDLDPVTDVTIDFFGTAAGSGFDANVYQYTFILPVPQPLNGKTWVSISAKTSATSAWVWAFQGMGDTIEPLFGTVNEWATGDGLGSWDNTANFSLAFAVLSPAEDSDGDGLSDDDELNVYFTDPSDPDTDDDGLDDGIEVDLQDGTGCPDPTLADSDGDSLVDGLEHVIGTDFCDDDTDGDFIPDNIDPDPLGAAETPSEIAEFALFVADHIATADPSAFAGRNVHSQGARQRKLTRRLEKAATLITKERNDKALRTLDWVLVRTDGIHPPPDWVVDPAERALLQEFIEITMSLIP